MESGFNLVFPHQSRCFVRMHFKIDQRCYVVSLSKSGKKPISMKVDPFFQLGGTTDIENIAVLVGENVGVPHTAEYGARAHQDRVTSKPFSSCPARTLLMHGDPFVASLLGIRR